MVIVILCYRSQITFLQINNPKHIAITEKKTQCINFGDFTAVNLNLIILYLIFNFVKVFLWILISQNWHK